MKRPKVLIVIGTRLEAIKMAPTVLELQARSKDFQPIVCATAQHRTAERPEGMEAGNAYLVGTDYDKIVERVSLPLSDPAERNKMAAVNNPYGDGTPSKQIADAIVRHFAPA